MCPWNLPPHPGICLRLTEPRPYGYFCVRVDPGCWFHSGSGSKLVDFQDSKSCSQTNLLSVSAPLLTDRFVWSRSELIGWSRATESRRTWPRGDPRSVLFRRSEDQECDPGQMQRFLKDLKSHLTVKKNLKVDWKWIYRTNPWRSLNHSEMLKQQSSRQMP